MAKLVVITLFLAMLLPPLIVDGAINKRLPSNLNRIKASIEQGTQEVEKVRKDIYQLEKNISLGNIRLKKSSKILSGIDTKIYELQEELKIHADKLNKELLHGKKIFKITVLQMLSGEESEAGLATKAVLLKGLKSKISEMKKIKLTLTKHNESILVLQKRFKEIEADRSELLSVLDSMELNKVSLVDKYVSVSKKADSFKMRLEKLQANRTISKQKKKGEDVTNFEKYGLSFMPPLSKFVKLDHGKKGLSYHFKESSPVVAPESGKVVYQGRLANYGKVLMIEHGNQVKSIILGDFLSKVKKGITVTKGDILGYSRAIAKNEGTIYFEVREKNKVKNTIYLLDKKYLSEKDLKTI